VKPHSRKIKNTKGDLVKRKHAGRQNNLGLVG